MAKKKIDINKIKYREFKNFLDEFTGDVSLEVFRRNRDSVDIRKEKTALKNYGKIFDAVFKISSEKGFQAMSLRDLSAETGLSPGALYRYFAGKDELLEIILLQGQSMMKRALKELLPDGGDPREQLRAAIRIHLFLSEAARDWFFFAFMEARSLEGDALAKVLAMEAYTEKVLVDILRRGEKKKVFAKRDHALTAGMIKAMQQDWYLKRWKYAARKTSVDKYAETVIEIVEAYCLKD